MSDSSIDEQTWGACVYRHEIIESRKTRVLPEGCPTWVSPSDRSYCYRRGLLVWDNTTRQLEALSAAEALTLGNKLGATDVWRTKGIVINSHALTRATQNTETAPSSPRKKRDKKAQTDQKALPSLNEEKSRDGIWVFPERFRLPPDAGEKLILFIRSHEAELKEIAKEDEENARRDMKQVYQILAEAYIRAAGEDQEIAKRKFPWAREAKGNKIICELPLVRATAYMDNAGSSWQVRMEQPDKDKQVSDRFTELSEAFDWAERQMQPAQDIVVPETADTSAPVDKPLYKPLEYAAILQTELPRYWVGPSKLESERITYKLIVEIDCIPYDYKTMMLSDGKPMRYDEHFHTSRVMACELKLDTDNVDGSQLLGDSSGYSKFTSHTAYYMPELAIQKAQQLWDQSLVVAYHKQGKVVSAHYGYTEVETGFRRWLGGCEGKDEVCLTPITREEHMADLAIRETLAYALDVQRFRAYLAPPSDEFASKYFTDEKLLQSLHRHRSLSNHIPLAVKAESQRWLKKHKVRPN